MTFVSLLDDARVALAGAPREPLGVLREPRRILGMARPARIVEVGRAWHLGVLLVADDAVYATGEIIRARQDAPRGYTAQSQRARAELAAAARRGGFAEGQLVHIGWHALDPRAADRGDASGPLTLRDGIPCVRWSATGAHVPLAGYLTERIALLREPPPGA